MLVDTNASLFQVVYPFRFDAATFSRRSWIVDEALWPTERGTMPVWGRKTFPVFDLMPHIRDYLLDSNTLLSGFVGITWPDSTPGSILRAWIGGDFELVVSDPILIEVALPR